MKDQNDRPTFVGPHEDRELELMLSGQKPLSMFFESLDEQIKFFPENEFDELVDRGALIKHVKFNTQHVGNNSIAIRMILYSLPEEFWRINAMMFIQDLYSSLKPGWRFDLERCIGLLLGYDRNDIEQFISWKSDRQ